MPFYPPKPNLAVINAGTTYSGAVLNLTNGQINLSGSVAVFDAFDLEITNGTISVYPNTLSVVSALGVTKQSVNNATLVYSTVFDLLSAVPTVGYSVRQLSSAYTGQCMNVRRSSDNTAMDIGFVNGLLNTASLLTFCGSGNGFVTTWYNQGTFGSAGNATQSTAANQPQIVTSGVLETQNGIPAIYFTGSSELDASSNLPTGSATGGLNAVVGVPNVANSYSFFHYGTVSSGEARFLEASNTNGFQAGNYSTTSPSNTILFNTLYTMTGLFNSTQVELFLNGTSYNTNTNSNLTSGTGITIGRTPFFGYITGYVSELIGFSGYNPSDRTTLELNQASFYNIAGVT